MANEVTQAVISVHKGLSNPILPIITVEEVITDGSGMLTEKIFGGQVTITLELQTGHETRPIVVGEFVYARGLRNGIPFSLTTPLIADTAKKPWKFTRVSGSTGP